jgi:hypothetical protein
MDSQNNQFLLESKKNPTLKKEMKHLEDGKDEK